MNKISQIIQKMADLSDELSGLDLSGMDLLEAEAASAPAVVSTQPDIPALREKLAMLVSTGKSKEAIGVQLSHEQVKRLSDKDVEKYTKRYQAYVGSKTTDSLIDSFIFLTTKAVGMAVDIDDINALQKELRNDWIISNELSNLAGGAALYCGRFLALANALLITSKHIDFSGGPSGDPKVWDGQPLHIAPEVDTPTNE